MANNNNFIFTSEERKNHLISEFAEVSTWFGKPMITIGNSMIIDYAGDTVVLTVEENVASLIGIHESEKVYEYRFNFEAGMYLLILEKLYTDCRDSFYYENADMLAALTMKQIFNEETGEYEYPAVFELVNKPEVIDMTVEEPKETFEEFMRRVLNFDNFDSEDSEDE